jgi:hypothetical protein
MESKNYWAGHTGSENPPPPSFRVINGQRVLGRYMDPWGCQWMMNRAQRFWAGQLEQLVPSTVTTAAAGVAYPGLLLGLPINSAINNHERNKARELFMYYREAQQQMHQTGEPIWVAYDPYRGQGPYPWP